MKLNDETLMVSWDINTQKKFSQSYVVLTLRLLVSSFWSPGSLLAPIFRGFHDSKGFRRFYIANEFQ